jgi:hypothetical protein
MRFWNPIKWIGSHWQLLRKCVAWAAVLVLSVAAVIALGWYPIWQTRSVTDPHDQERLELENRLRLTVAQIVGGAAVLVGVYLTLRRVKAAEDQVRIAQEGQITERFTRAIEQLGSDKLEVRLGGIYALERIARDSEKDHWTIMEVLTAYVREHARWTDKDGERAKINEQRQGNSWGDAPLPSQEVQAILTVIGRRSLSHEAGKPYRLDFRGASLRKASFQGGSFARADFDGAHLEAASFRGADVSNADFSVAFLDDADFPGANGAHAIFKGAGLNEADFREGGDLSNAVVSQRQVNAAKGDGTTRIPKNLVRPSHWQPG